MADLFGEVVAFATGEKMVDAQARELGVGSGAPVRDAAVLATAIVVAGFARWSATGPGEDWLRTQLATVDPSSLDRIPELSANRDFHRLGVSVMARLLGQRRDEIVDRIAAQSRLEHDDAAVVVATTVWATVVHLARQQRQQSAVHDLPTRLADERADLIDAGWGPWIELLGVPLRGPDPDDRRDGNPSDSTEALPVVDRRVDRPDERPAAPPSRSRWRPMMLGLLLLVGLVGVGAFVLSRRTTDQAVGGDTASSATTTTIATSSSNGASGGTNTTEQGAAASAPDDGPTSTIDGPEVDATIPDVAEYSLDLVDPTGRAEANGTLDLQLDTVTGEVCYAYDVVGVATPFASHIHVGPTATNGGITVDFGPLNGTSTGCVDSEPADLIAAVSRPSQRYVEVHDPTGAVSVRAQLTDPEPGETSGEPEPAGPPGAYTAVVDGAVVLRGEVPDQETVSALVESVGDLEASSISVVNELTVAPGAPPPSGVVVIEDSILFGFDSVELSDADLAVLSDIAAIVSSRPSWSILVVGNTDSSGSVLYNFSLSLRRAQAVRRALIDLDVPALSVRIQGDGPTNPTGANETLTGRAGNRRIDLLVEVDR